MLAAIRFLIFDLQVKAVQEAVSDGRDQHAGDGEERHPGEEGVESSEQFCRGGFERVDRTHAAQDHGGVEQRVDPGKTANEVVASDADEQCKGDNGNRQERVPQSRRSR